MKTFKKAASALIALVLIAATCFGLVSCKKKGGLLATYKGGEVRTSDVEDWQKYFLSENLESVIYDDDGNIRSESDRYLQVQEICDSTTKYVVEVKAFKQLLEDEGIATFSDSSIKKYAKVLRSQIEEEYAEKGGYAYWRDYACGGVSDNFIYQFSESELVRKYLESYVMEHYPVTDELIMEYYRIYAQNYLVVPEYRFNVILVAVGEEDMGNEAAWDAAKEEAQGYIDRLNAGEKYEDVLADALENSKNKNIAEFYSVTDAQPISTIENFKDLEAGLESIQSYVDEATELFEVEFKKYATPEEDDANVYNIWYGYCNMTNQLYVCNTVYNLEIGQTGAEPILFLEGYEVIQLVEKTDSTYFKDPKNNQDIHDEIYQILYNEMWNGGQGTSVDAFLYNLAVDYEIDIVYSYAESYKKSLETA